MIIYMPVQFTNLRQYYFLPTVICLLISYIEQNPLYLNIVPGKSNHPLFLNRRAQREMSFRAKIHAVML